MKRAARRIVEKLRLHGHEAFFAGGWVRDFLLRRRPKDIDIATSALPEEVIRMFPRSRGIGAQFGVVQVRMYGRDYEVATFRSDQAYLDGRRPSSVVFSGPEQDAWRRDFTINGLFYDPIADRLIDYVHGKNDIQARVIRTIGDPRERFAEDKLRMLRAIRLSATLAFSISTETWNAIRELAPQILQVSWERIRDELTRIFTGPDPGSGLTLLHDSGLLGRVLPEAEAPAAFEPLTLSRTALSMLRRPSVPLAFAALLNDAGPDAAAIVCRRLRMSNDEIRRVIDLISGQEELARIDELRGSAIKRLLRNPDFAERMELFRARCLSKGVDLSAYERWQQQFTEHEKSAHPAPLLRGEDLTALGYRPGPVFKDILRAVEDLQLEGTLTTREEALDHVRTAFPLGGANE